MYLVMMFDRNKVNLTANVYNIDDIEDALTLHLKDYNINKYRFNKHVSKEAPDSIKFNNYDKVIQSLKKDDIYIDIVTIPYNTVSIVVFFDNFTNEFMHYVNKETSIALQNAIKDNKIFELGSRLDTLSLVSKSKFATDKALIFSNILCKTINNVNSIIYQNNTNYSDILFKLTVEPDSDNEVYISIYDTTYDSTLEIILSTEGVTVYKNTYTEIPVNSQIQLLTLLNRAPSNAKEVVKKLIKHYELNLLSNWQNQAKYGANHKQPSILG